VKDVIKMVWKEVIVACFKVLSQHMPEKPEENHKIPLSE
jgi:hypothetical protein